jgi:predicted Zn-dependent peptidase
MVEFMREIRRIGQERISAAELAETQRSIVGGFALSMEEKDTLLNYAVTRKLYDLPADYWETYPAKIMAVTADDIARVARRYMNPETLQIVAVGDGAKIRSLLAQFGPVETYNVDGVRTP